MTFIANNTLNRSGQGSGAASVNTAFDGKGNNDDNGNKYMDYVDIDSDASTFSSSSATLTLPGCSQVTYAGLYWAAIYPYDHWDEKGGANTRDSDFNTMKFKLPGAASYLDITADNIIYDDGISTEKPYVCYKDVTSLVQGLSDPNGVYFGANIKATIGKDKIPGFSSLGSSAGWVLMVIYENETESRKKFFVFDGFSTIKLQSDGSAGEYDVPFSGFTTIPTGQVGANFLIATLEGDVNIDGDSFQIQDTSNNFQALSTPSLNDTDNFFNSTITVNDAYLSGRNLDSENTLGLDVDFFELNNPGNTLIGNNQTSGVMRFSSEGDTYWPFLLGLSVEVIEPEVRLVKTIDDGVSQGSNNLGGTDVSLGDYLWYDISFQNIGSDDATNTVVIDRLPKNVYLIESDIILPSGVTYTYEEPSAANEFRGELRFSIPDGYVEQEDPAYHIRLRVQVAPDCTQLRDVCSNVIENQAAANYEGVVSGIVIENEDSFADVDACGFGVVGASNFLIDADGCTFERNQIICGASTTLVAGSGFISYSWENAANPGVVIGTDQTYEATAVGTYIVTRVAPVGCIGQTETIHVISYDDEPNPLTSFADQVLTCANNGLELAEMYLCTGDTRTINLPFDPSSATTVRWFQLDEASCDDETQEGCPNVNTACTWNEFGNSELSQDFTDAGEYRLDVLYDGQCPRSYYFNVYKATLTPQIVVDEIICGNAGTITINNVPPTYQYSLSGIPGTATDGYFVDFQDSNVFSVTQAGDYDLTVRLNPSEPGASCTYSFDLIYVGALNIDLQVQTEDMLCANGPAIIRAQIKNVPGPYTYTLTNAAGNTIGSPVSITDNSYEFTVNDGGDYTMSVSTAECSASTTVTINEPAELTLSAIKTKDISCENGSSPGIIELTANGGTIDTTSGNSYTFAIWSIDGTDLYSDISAIPLSAQLTSGTNTYTYTVPVGSEGTYEFVVIDHNNCYTISGPIEVVVEPELQFTHTETNITCFGDNDGTINVGVNGDNLGYSVEYSIDNATWNFTGVFDNLLPGTYTVYIRASKSSYQCLYEIPNLLISEPTQLTGGSAAATDLECDPSGGTIFGTITFTDPSGGTLGYTYEYKLSTDTNYATATSNPVAGLTAGTYNTRVVDANGCIINLNDVTIAGLPAAPTLSSSVTYNCDGTGNVTITTTPAGTYTFTLGADSNNTGIFNNVAVGAHTVSVAYGSNCNEVINVDVIAGNEFTATITGSTPNVCFNSNNGTITIDASNYGGVSYEYSTNGGTSWTTTTSNPTVVTVADGTYDVQVRPNSSSIAVCTLPIGTVTIANPTPVIVVAQVTKEVTCDPATGATISITDTNGGNGAPYTYELFDNLGGSVSTTAPFTDVAAGDYTVVATDSQGCESAPFAITVNAITNLVFDVTPVLCYDGTNGTLTVNVSSGNGGYSYSLDGGTTWQASNIFTNLTDGAYNVTVLDSRGCTDTQSATILPQVTATITPVSATCNDGQIVITPSGGDGNFVFVVENTSTGVITNHTTSPIDIPAGTYNVSVRDKNGGTDYCEYSSTITINQIVDPTITTSTVQPDCNADTGTINVTVANGVADYTVTVTGPTTPPAQTGSGLNYTFTGLAAGNYTISVTDANGCTSPVSNETITAPPALTGGSAAATDLMCSPTGTILGTITFTAPSGGTPGYTYFYAVAGSGSYVQIAGTTVSNINPGTYDTRVVDANGCPLDLNQVTIADLPTEPTLASSVSYNCDGTGDITVTPLDASYVYTLDGGTTIQTGNNVFTNVPVGAHTISVAYGSNCSVDINVNVEPNQQFTAAVTGQTNPVCIGDSNGTITVEASFPSSAPASFDYSTDGGTTWTNSGANPFTIPGFSAGTHNIQVRPAGVTSGCDVPLASVTLTDPTPVTVVAQVTKEVTCDPATGATISITDTNGGNGAPYDYELFDNLGGSVSTTAPFTDVAAGDYTVVATDSQGCASAPFAITVVDKADVTFTPVPQCYDGTNGEIEITVNTGNGDYSYSLDGGVNYTPVSTNPFTISGLGAATYNIRVQDGRGCFADGTATINPQLFATATPTNASCVATGEILVNPTGGSGSGYEFSVVPDGSGAGAYSGTNPITGLAPNTYDVYVRDDAGCIYIVQDVIIDTTTPVDITATVNEPTCNGDTGSVDGQIVANTGQAPHTIVLTDGSSAVVETISNFTGSNFNFNNLGPDSYTITITDDLGCQDTFTFTLTNPPAIVVDIQDVLPSSCIVDPANTGFNFINVNPTDYLPNTLQYSLDNGNTWVDFSSTNGQIRGLNSGDVVFPALQTIDGSGNTLCLVSYGRYEIAFNVSGLIVDPIANPGNCSVGFSVTVEALGGGSTSVFEFAINSPSGWVGPDALNNGTLGDPDRTYTFTGLTPGLTYEFFVRDTKGTADPSDDCIERNNEDLYADFTPTVPITPTVNNNQCNGSSNGQITFSIDNSSGDLNNDFTWTLYERDPITNVGSPVSAAYTNVPQNLFADIITTGLSSGVYYIILTNTTGGPPVCEFGSLDVVVEEGTPIQGNLNALNDITCSVDGAVRIENVSGGFPGYVYTVSAYETGTPANTVPFNLSGNLITVDDATLGGVTSVDVEVLVTDTNGCTTNLGPVTLALISGPVLEAGDITTSSCDVNKTITITGNNGVALGGTPPYQYSNDGGTTFTAPTSNTTYTFTGLTPGNYDMVVRDANGCEASQNGITIYPDIDFNLQLGDNATCIPGNDGEVIINVTSGTGGNYNYSFDTGSLGTINSPATTVTVGSLSPGVHNVTVTDVTSGCSDVKQITVQNPVNPNFTYVAENSLCFNDNSGTITLIPITNGAEPTSYSISPIAGTITGNVISDLPPATYSVTGTAANGCTFTINNITIGEYAQIVPTAPVVDEFGCSSGNTPDVATVTVPGAVGGSGNYVRYVFTYTPVTGTPETQDSNNPVFTTTNTAGGTVDILVYDDQGCSGNVSTDIDPFDALTFTNINLDTAITCSAGADITVNYTSTLGTAANITIEGINGNAYPATTQNAVASGDFDNLPTGDYQITIAHPTTGCEIVTYYTVDDAPEFDLLITEVKDESCKDAENGKVVLEFSSSTPYGGQYDFELYDAATNTSIDLGITGLNVPHVGVIAPTDVHNLPSGTYYIIATLTDAPNNTCTARTANFTINEPDDNLDVTAVVNPVISCFDADNATITATATGGWGSYVYQLELVSNPGVAYNGYTFSTNNVFTNVEPGDYRVVARDKNGDGDLVNIAEAISCRVSEFPITVANPDPVTFTVVENDNACDTSVDGSIEVNANGGTGTYVYSITGTLGYSNTQTLNANTYTFSNLPADTYTVNVVDSNGCDAGTPTDITINPDVNFSLVETKKVDCSASPDGVVTVDLVNWSATSNYEYDISGSVDGALAANVAITSDPFTITIPSANATPQTYTVTVRDLGATPVCSVSKDILIEPEIRPVFTPTVTVNDICFGSSDGEISVTPTDNGILPLTYTISPDPNGASGVSSNTTVVFGNLPAGAYTITAVGDNGCDTPMNVTIRENTEIDI
ncbi:beta strand repeat-containing protein, partial [Tenacibaculum crassostreae]|uniref:beta strand repeat-containing protein n=1 Tax=Tenacibaculum crassostreae TaxID=502683 RepID=UPI0038B6268E